jgi:transcriptional regulator with XRE-family HTH domain
VGPGELLREARRRHGLTQKQLATRASTSQAAISRIERGVVSPSVAMLERLLWLIGKELQLATKPIDHGIDLTLVRANLALTPEQRIRRMAERANKLRGSSARSDTRSLLFLLL